MLPTDVEGWEALTADEFKALNPSADTVRDVIRDDFGLGSKCYFMTKVASIEYILNPDRRPAILADSEAKYAERQKRGAELRTGGKVEERVLEKADGHEYVFVAASRPDKGFTDPFSGRKGKIAYLISDIQDEAELPVQKKTALILEEAGLLTGFDPRISQKKVKPAHEAGLNTLEDVIVGADPAAAAAAAEIIDAIEIPEAQALTAEAPAEDMNHPTTSPTSNAVDQAEAELDDILNTLPQ